MKNVISFTSVVLLSSCQIKSYLLAGLFKQFSVQNNRSREFFSYCFSSLFLKLETKLGEGRRWHAMLSTVVLIGAVVIVKFVYMSTQKNVSNTLSNHFATPLSWCIFIFLFIAKEIDWKNLTA